MKIALASDHAGYALKERVKAHLAELGYESEDFGTHSEESCDYADFAHPAAEAVESGRCGLGIAMCGSGNGIQMTLNKHQGIRAALCWLPELAALARQHNDANILVLPARFITEEAALQTVDTYLSSSFEGGRHARRIAKIPVGTAEGSIEVELDCTMRANIGVFEHERRDGNDFRVEVRVTTADSGDDGEYLSYADLYELVKEEMAKPRELLETAARAIGRGVSARWPQAMAVDCRITKLHPPIAGLEGEAGIRLRRKFGFAEG